MDETNWRGRLKIVGSSVSLAGANEGWAVDVADRDALGTFWVESLGEALRGGCGRDALVAIAQHSERLMVYYGNSYWLGNFFYDWARKRSLSLYHNTEMGWVAHRASTAAGSPGAWLDAARSPTGIGQTPVEALAMLFCELGCRWEDDTDAAEGVGGKEGFEPVLLGRWVKAAYTMTSATVDFGPNEEPSRVPRWRMRLVVDCWSCGRFELGDTEGASLGAHDVIYGSECPKCRFGHPEVPPKFIHAMIFQPGHPPDWPPKDDVLLCVNCGKYQLRPAGKDDGVARFTLLCSACKGVGAAAVTPPGAVHEAAVDLCQCGWCRVGLPLKPWPNRTWQDESEFIASGPAPSVAAAFDCEDCGERGCEIGPLCGDCFELRLALMCRTAEPGRAYAELLNALSDSDRITPTGLKALASLLIRSTISAFQNGLSVSPEDWETAAKAASEGKSWLPPASQGAWHRRTP